MLHMLLTILPVLPKVKDFCHQKSGSDEGSLPKNLIQIVFHLPVLVDFIMMISKAGLSIDWIGQVPRGTNHLQPVEGAPHDTGFKNVFLKCLHYSLEIVERHL